MKTIGLCVIARNEAPVILACLESVRPLIDYALVVDTGSTDGTQQLVADYLWKHGLPGEVVEEPWQDFATNRNLALAHLRQRTGIDYALVIDADDRLEAEPGFSPTAFKAAMTQDLYNVTITLGDLRYHRPQIFSNRLDFRYRGVVHEFLEGPTGHSSASAAGFKIVSGRGGARSRDPDKYKRDAELLEKALASENDDFLRSRYTFYLAQSYRDAGEDAKALAAYEARAKQGHWLEEIYISRLNAARCRERLGEVPAAVIGAYLAAFEVLPARAEALYGAARYCRIARNFAQGYLLGKQALAIAQPAGGLFIETHVYGWSLEDEFSICAYWAGHYAECAEACRHLLAGRQLPEAHRQRVSDNLRFALERLGAGGATPPTGTNEPAASAASPPPAPASSPPPLDSLGGALRVVNDHGLYRLIQPAAPTRPEITLCACGLPGYIHAAAYQEVVEIVFHGLRMLDLTVGFATQPAVCQGRTILIGGHLLSAEAAADLPAETIVLNTEKVGSHWIAEGAANAYLDLLARFPVWDFSADNARRLGSLLNKPVAHFPLGYVPQLTRVAPAAIEDIDVLLIGSHSERRNAVMDELKRQGARTFHAFGIYGAERDALIARARIVLNAHYRLPGAFEIVRLSYLFANRKAVVSEQNAGEAIDADLAGGFIAAPYEGLAAACRDLLKDEARRRALGDVGFERFSARSAASILAKALAGR